MLDLQLAPKEPDSPMRRLRAFLEENGLFDTAVSLAASHGLTLEETVSRRYDRSASQARADLAELFSTYGLSSGQVGRLLGRDGSSIRKSRAYHQHLEPSPGEVWESKNTGVRAKVLDCVRLPNGRWVAEMETIESQPRHIPIAFTTFVRAWKRVAA